MKTARLLVAALLLASPALRADTPATRQWVLATAKARGAGGEDFVSSLRIVNPWSAPANVRLTYLAQSPIDASGRALGDNGSAAPVALSVGPSETLALEDVVGTLFADGAAPFGIPAGGIRVDSDLPVSVQSRTYVANATNASGVPGTFGFTIPAQAGAQAVAAGETAWLTWVSASPVESRGFRSNFIMLNTASGDASVHVSLVRGDGTEVGERTYTLGRYSAAQQTRIGESFGVSTAETNLRLLVTVGSGGPVVVGLSIIDNAISSLNYAPPAKVAVPGDGAYGWVASDDPAAISSGRVDLLSGSPNYVGGLVYVSCPSGGRAFSFVGYGSGSGVPAGDVNTTFTKRADGGWDFAGSSPSAGSWSGTVLPWVDGSLFGSLAFTSAPTATGCPSVATTYAYRAGRALDFGATP